jgi:hypothetical protein
LKRKYASKKQKRLSLPIFWVVSSGFALSISASFYQGYTATAADKTPLVRLQNAQKVVVNSSFISPLVELFGDVSIGKKSICCK